MGNDMDSREQFEEWWKTLDPNKLPRGFGQGTAPTACWQAWQAGRAPLLARIAELKAEIFTLRNAAVDLQKKLEARQEEPFGYLHFQQSRMPEFHYRQQSHPHDEMMAVYAAPPLREGWVSVPRYATQKQINAMAKLDLPNTPYCEIYAAAITASEEGT